MKNIRRYLQNTRDKIVDELFSIHKKESNFLTNKSTTTKPKTLKLSRNTYFELDRFFLRFFNSKPIRGILHNKSLAFVVGAQHSGKTQFIQKNLAQIHKRKKQLQSQFATQTIPQFNATTSPESHQTQIQQSVFDNSLSLIVKKNYKEQGGQLNFTNFIQDLHDQIIAQIHDLMINFQNSQKNNPTHRINNHSDKDKSNQSKNMSLLTTEIIKQIVLHEYAPEYIFIHIKDVIFAIIEQKDAIFLKQQHRIILEQWNDDNVYAGACTVEQFFDNLYHPLIELLWNATKLSHCDLKATEDIQKTQIAIQLFRSVFMRIEYENRTPDHSSSWYQTGIETSNFFFDILNFLTGTGKYLEHLEKTFTHAETNQEREEAKKYLEQSNNFILLGNHVDVMLCMLNMEDLMCFKSKSKGFFDFFDHLICRTVNSSNIRKHFPVMIEIPNRAFLDETLQLGKMEGSNPVIIEIPGYIQSFMKYTNVIEVFEEEKLVKMFEKFGRNPHTWKLMLESMGRGETMETIEDGKAEYQVREKRIAEAKMNRVYTSARCLPYMNEQTLDFEIRQLLEVYSRINGLGSAMHSFVGTVLYKQPYFTSMVQQNIFYHMYYLPYVDYSVNLPAYLSFFRDEYIPKLKRNNSQLAYKKWRIVDKEYWLVNFDIKYKRKTEVVLIENQTFGKEYVDLEFASTYHGPLKDYGHQYYYNAHGAANVGLQ